MEGNTYLTTQRGDQYLKDKCIKARKGVVLCTGGFEFNEDMKKNYLRPTSIKFTGWKYNTGDGIRMVQAVGADLWHMNLICSASCTIVTPESEMGWMYPEPKGSNFILVAKYGQRFVKEGDWFTHYSVELKKGWIKKADSIAALAEAIGGEMTPDALTATVTRWNGFCDAGVDSDFGRSNARSAIYYLKYVFYMVRKFFLFKVDLIYYM